MKPSSLALLTAALGLCAEATFAEPHRPNVVVFLADDAGWGDYRVSGNTQLDTPNIDSLARDGVSLER